MRRTTCARLLFALFLTLAAAGAAGAYNLTFRLYNNSGWVFSRVLVSPAGARTWRPSVDRVNIRPLRSGYNIEISSQNSQRLRNNSNIARWDIRIYYGDTYAEYHDIPFYSITQFWVDSDFYATWD